MSAVEQPPPPVPRAWRLAMEAIEPDAAGMPLCRAVECMLLTGIEAGRMALGEPLSSEAPLSAGWEGRLSDCASQVPGGGGPPQQRQPKLRAAARAPNLALMAWNSATICSMICCTGSTV